MEFCANSNINWTKNIFAFAIPMGETNISHYNYLKSSPFYFFEINGSNVMATLGPGWQMMDSFGLWWTNVNEIRNLSSFWPGGLNGGVKS